MARGLRMEPLEDRRLLATYAWDGAGNLGITLENSESLTLEETGTLRSFTLSPPTATFVQAGEFPATGDGTATISFNLTQDISDSISVSGGAVGPHNVIFDGGVIASSSIVINAGNAGATSQIEFTNGVTTLSGTTSLTSSGGNIFDSTGALDTAGNVTLNAGANDVVLDSPFNDFVNVAVPSAANATLVSNDNVDLGASTITGTLSITSGGNITDNGASSVGGTTTLNANGGAGVYQLR